MKIELSALQARIIGCLIEKQITTPDQYPLSLNALVSACNPVVSQRYSNKFIWLWASVGSRSITARESS
jgi:hypothetical protein